MREYSVKCDHCQQNFPCNGEKWKKANYARKTSKRRFFCSKKCRFKGMNQKELIEIVCVQCGKTRLKYFSDYKKTKNHFCSRSCAATFNNQNKTHGTRRSKLEIYLEK